MRFYKEDLTTMLPILIAIENGKTVQCRKIGDDTWNEISFIESNETNLTLSGYQYRVKPESKLVPFTFKDAEFLIGKLIKSTSYESVGIITNVNCNEVIKGRDSINFGTLMCNYTFLGGSPCGKLVETSNK